MRANSINFFGGASISNGSQGGININNNLSVNNNIQANSIGFNNGGFINSDSQGGLSINAGNGQISAGNIGLSGNNIMFFGAGGTNSSIWSDGNGGLSFNNGEAAIDRTGNISTFSGININHGTTVLDPSGNIHANWFNGLGVNASIGITCQYLDASGVVSAQSYVTSSDRNMKEKFTPIDNQEILERVASLPISCWNFKTGEKTRHIGPMAQDFYAAFNVGPDDKHIATVDEDGVALAAIQGLHAKLKERDARIDALEKRLADLEQMVHATRSK